MAIEPTLKYTVRCSKRLAAALLLFGLPLANPIELTAQDTATVVLSGVVRDTLGNPIAHARVEASGARAVTSNQSGEFSIPGLPAGTLQLTVRRLGFRPWFRTIEAGRPETIDVRLIPTAISLERVVVQTAPREVSDSRLSGFEQRRRSLTGEYIDRSQIEKLSSNSLVDVLRRVRGVRVTTLGNTMLTRVRLRGASCPPLVFVDGQPFLSGEFDLSMVEVGSLEGVEIYHGMASMPAEFVTGRSEQGCGVVAIWSRPARTEVRRPAPSPPSVASTTTVQVDIAELLATGNVYTADGVDEAAELERGTRLPQYPESLFAAGVSGQVLVEFVVNIAGAVEPATMRMVSSTHPLFAESVRNAILGAKFTPARIGAARVRQVVQLPFEFRISPDARPLEPLP